MIRVLCDWPRRWLRYNGGERCAFLLGKSLPDRTYVFQVLPCPNLSDDPGKFIVSRHAYETAKQLAAANGLHIVGLAHTHPNGEAEPSEDDLAGLPKGWIGVVVTDDDIRFYTKEGAVPFA